MKRALIPVLAVVVLLVSSSPTRADFNTTDWPFYKEIALPQPLESEYAYFQVDGEIYDVCSDGLRSIRVIRGDSGEVAYEIVTKRESEHREEFFPKILNNSYLPGKYNSFVLDFGEEPPSVNELEVLTSSENFTRRASVEGSDDQAEWNTLVEEAYIFDFARNIRSHYLRIELPTSNFRFLRVKVFDDGSGVLKITGAKAFRVRKEEAQTEQWPLTIVERTENEKDRTTEIVLDARFSGLPIRQIDLDVASRNYHRSVHVQSSEDREKWIDLGSGIIFDYDLPEFKKADKRLSFRENSRGRYFKLTIENYDDQPLEVAGASGIGLVRRVILAVEEGAPYRVFFGNPRAAAPRYDLAHRIPYIETERLPRLALGPRQSNPDYVEKKPKRPWSEEHAYLLWVVMAAVIVFLALLIFNLARKTPPEGQGQ